ncbi:MAG: serine protease [Candidatus Aminicenantes bacterium]|nr:serine protease [Candidatus Aminicenantes bacterium]
MPSLPKQSIVRIRKEDESIVGAGVLISETQVVTCAHVVKEALNIGTKQIEIPRGNVKLDFPFLSPHKILTAFVANWPPTQSDSNKGLDIAILEITEFLHKDARPVAVQPGDNVAVLKGIDFSVIGFPKGYDDGVWSSGIVMDEIAGGLIQLEDTKVPGKRIEAGYSGGPVWNERSRNVMGIVALADKLSETKVAFMIPIKKILELYPWLIKKSDESDFIEIPIVIAAMTKSEAAFLLENTGDNDECVKFNQFLKNFNKSDISDWLSNYSEYRDDWKPHIYSEEKICNVIWDMAENINNFLGQEAGNKLIRPKFISNDFFNENDTDKQDEIWGEMRSSGSLVIADAISLFHPSIQKILLKSEICSHEKISVLGINPLNKTTIEANKMIELEIRECMRHSFNRYASAFEKSCEFGVNNVKSVERWLYNFLQETAKMAYEYRSNPNTKLKFRRQSGKPITGIGGLIRGGLR